MSPLALRCLLLVLAVLALLPGDAQGFLFGYNPFCGAGIPINLWGLWGGNGGASWYYYKK